LLAFTATSACMMEAQLQGGSESGVEGTITVSPASPGPARLGVPNSRPLANTTFLVQGAASPVRTFTTDAHGQFCVLLPPGHYTVSLKDSQPRIGRFGAFEVDVISSKMTSVSWQCDSGMR
ncbi:MAG TPA: hypothetical protein VFO30_06295, partial [Chthoniobacterales bacterium]|nr:hypothetical protein [Chthoniobacterales bacterium]